MPGFLISDGWLRGLCSAQEARKGGALTCKVRDVERLCAQDRLMAKVQARGFQIVRNGRHCAVFCTTEPIRRVM